MLELLLSTSGGVVALDDPGDNGGDAVNSCAGSLGLCAAEMLASSVWNELAEGYRLTEGGSSGGAPRW